MKLFRGTQSPELKGYHSAMSWTPSLPVAIVWSSMPPDVWSQRKAAFLPGSTVHIGELQTNKVLEISEYPAVTFGAILRKLKYGKPGGITMDEALRVLLYMHKRLIGKAKGGEFLYRILDEDGEEVEERDFPLSFTDPMTMISEFREDFESAGDIGFGDYLEADTYIFADAPAVQEVARRLGYEAMLYPDIFQGGSYVTEELIGLPANNLQGVLKDEDLEGEWVPVHDTYRPLVEGAIVEVESIPTAEVLTNTPREELRRI